MYVKIHIHSYKTNAEVHHKKIADLPIIPHFTSFIYTGFQIYNRLPAYLKEKPATRFKHDLKKNLHLLRSFYSIGEFVELSFIEIHIKHFVNELLMGKEFKVNP